MVRYNFFINQFQIWPKGHSKSRDDAGFQGPAEHITEIRTGISPAMRITRYRFWEKRTNLLCHWLRKTTSKNKSKNNNSDKNSNNNNKINHLLIQNMALNFLFRFF